MSGNILSIDIGGSKTVIGIVDTQGNIVCSHKTFLPEKYDAEYLINHIYLESKQYMEYYPIAVGVTIPGLCNSQKGVWCYAPFSGISDFPISTVLREKLGLEVYIENDVNACAIAEKRYGACKDDKSFLWVTVSNGIGGAIYLDGKLYTGESGNAGEIGHFIVEENTHELCGCGRYGCLEAMASGKGIENEYANVTGTRVDAKTLAKLAKNGDNVSMEIFNKAGRYIGKALSYSINLLNINKVVLGGGVSQSFELFNRGIKDSLDKYLFSQANRILTIEKTYLGYNAAIIGAAAVTIINISNKENSYV